MEVFTRAYHHDWSVVAPIPWFPLLPFRTGKIYDIYARIPKSETFRGHELSHPRYLVTPKIGMPLYGNWFTRGVIETVRAIHKRKPIDVIDGHYIYPDGTAAVRLGKALGIPVILSARGTDLNLYPTLPKIAPIIKTNLDACQHLICVCTELQEVALKLGVPSNKVSVIGNGVDVIRFQTGDKAQARGNLGLPMEKHIVISVGGMVERKGFHIVIEACARLGHKDLMVIIVGAGEERERLEKLSASLGFTDQVLFPGAIPNEQLTTWYQAADYFVLASSREGWPNVLCEAQACGLPSIATNAWGMPEIINDEKLGILVNERSVEGFKVAIKEAMNTKWDNVYIAEKGSSRTWHTVAASLETIFQNVKKTFNSLD